MARNFTNGSTTDYLTLPASTAWDINTNVCMLGVVYLTATGINQVVCCFGVAGTNGFSFELRDPGGVRMTFNKIGQGQPNGTATTEFDVNAWNAFAAFSTSGGDIKFKNYRYATGVLDTETVSNTNTITTPSNDPGRIGQWLSILALTSWAGRIARVTLVQADVSDNEFRNYAITGRLPRAMLGDWILFGNSPEADWSGNGNNATVTGTTIVAHAPVAPPFGFDEPFASVAVAGVANPKGPLGMPLVGALGGPV